MSALPFAAALLLALPGAALAYPCSFTIECYEAEACTAAQFTLDVNIPAKALTTEYGDLVIVAVKEIAGLTTLFATGEGAEYLLSITPAAARLSTHANDGPQAITYLGTCEGAF